MITGNRLFYLVLYGQKTTKYKRKKFPTHIKQLL